MDAVETHYVRSETGWIAYQVVGSGPVDVVVCRPALFSVDLMWDEPTLARFLDGLSSFSRHVWFDPRGTGASDPIDQAEGRLVESWVDDVVAVIDAVGCERVVVLGFWAPAAALFAATHPERTEALVLVNPSARLSRADGYPEGLPDDVLDERVNERAGALRYGVVVATAGFEFAGRCQVQSLGGACRAPELPPGRRGLAAAQRV